MGSIIKLPRAQVARPSDTADAPRAAAQILFFTGVRYERHQEPPAARKTRARRPLRKTRSA